MAGSTLAAKLRREHDSQSGFGVLDLAVLDQPKRARQLHGLEGHELIGLVRSLASLESGCHKEMDFLVREPWRREHREEEIDLLRPAAGLLSQFSRGTMCGVFPR